MNVQLPVHMDKAAFLAWAQGRERAPAVFEGDPATIPLAVLGLSVALADVYSDVELE